MGCDISGDEFDLNLSEEKFTTPIGLQIQLVLENDGTIDIFFRRQDSSPKEATFEGRRVEAIRYSDNAEEGHRLLAAASEFEMKALMETHNRYLECETNDQNDDIVSPTTSPEDEGQDDNSLNDDASRPSTSPTKKQIKQRKAKASF